MSPVTPVLGRILRSADFERVLGYPACGRSQHFAVHYLDAQPSRAIGAAVCVRAGKVAGQPKLSTTDELVCTQGVDDLPERASLGDADDLARRWFGAVVPKRHAKRAVTRTLIKRQIRAALSRCDRTGEPGLRPGLWVVRLRSPFDRAVYPSAASQALRQATGDELDGLLGQARRKLGIAPRAPCTVR